MKRFLVKYVLGSLAFLFLMSSSEAYSFPYKGLDITIQPSVSEQFDDNLTFSAKDQKSDFSTQLGLAMEAKYEGKRRMLELKGMFNRSFQSRFKDIKTSSESISLNFENEFSKYVNIEISDSLSHSYAPAGFEEEFGRVTGRRESYVNMFNIKVTGVISEHYTTTMQCSNYIYDYPDDDGRVDSSVDKVALTLNYLPSTQLSYFLVYSYSKNNFDNYFQSGRIGIKRFITKKLYLDGSLGAGVNSTGNSSMSMEITLTNAIDEKSVAKLSLTNGDDFSFFGGDIFQNWKLNAYFSSALSKRLFYRAAIFYGEGTFETVNVKNKLYGVNIFASYEISEDLKGSLSFSSSKLESSVKNGGYLRNTVSMNLSKVF